LARIPTFPLRRPALTAATLTFVVVLPLAGMALRADERFKIYRYGAHHAGDPAGVLTYPIESIGPFLRLGNFRPLGRLVEHAQFLVAYETVNLAAIPTHIANGLWRILTISATAAVLVWFVARFTGPGTGQGAAYGLLAGVLFAATLVGAGNVSAVVMFSTMYFGSAIIVLLVCGAFVAIRRAGERTSPTHGRLVAFAALGAVCASFNELTYLALPLSAITVLATVPGHERDGSFLERLGRTGQLQRWIAFALGFAVVSLPVRVAIYRICSQPGAECYEQTHATLEGWSLWLLTYRVAVGVPYVGWMASYPGMAEHELGPVLGALVVLAGLVAALAVGVALTGRGTATLARDTHTRSLLGLTVLGAGFVVLAATVASLSEGVQTGRPGAGWRETPFTLVGMALVGTAVLGSLRRWIGTGSSAGRVVIASACAIVAVTVGGTMTYNIKRVATDGAHPEWVLHNEIALSVATFDRSSEGDGRRCELVRRLEETATESLANNLVDGLDIVARQRAGVPYCSRR
jgi:hypothetical protein